jgi:hypothetical protein
MLEIILDAVRHLVLSLQVLFIFTASKIEAISNVLARAFDELWILFFLSLICHCAN